MHAGIRNVTLGLLLTAGGAWAQGPEGPRFGATRRLLEGDPGADMPPAERVASGPMHDELMTRILTNTKLTQELALSEEQISEIQDALAELRATGELLREEMQLSAEEQGRLLTAEPLDEEALMNAIEKTGELRTEIAKLRVRPLILLREILTPEQIKMVMGRIQDRRERRPPPGEQDLRRDNQRRARELPTRRRHEAGKEKPRPIADAGEEAPPEAPPEE